MADGSIVIETKLNTKGATSQLTSLENRIVKATDKMSSLNKEMDNMKNTKVPTAEYKELQDQINLSLKKTADLVKKMEDNPKSKKLETWRNQVAELTVETTKMQKITESMRNDGTAFTSQAEANPEKYQKLGDQLRYAKSEMQLLTQKHDELVRKNSSSFGIMEKTVSGFSRRVTRLLLRVFIFSQITKAFRAMVSSLQEGFKNLAQYSEKYNASMSQLKSAQAELKNNMAAAFEPIMNWIVPALAQLCGWLSTAAETISKIHAVLGGGKTYTKAAKQAINYANAVKEADKAQKGALASFDDLNVLNKNNGGSSSGEVTGAGAFEEGTISDEFASRVLFIKGILEQILPFVILIGAAFAAWKITKLVDQLMGLDPTLAKILGIIVVIASLAFSAYQYFKMWTEGVNWKGIIGYVSGIAVAVGILIALGNPLLAGIVLLVAGLSGIVLAIKDILEAGLNAENMGLLMISTIMLIVGALLVFGPTVAGVITLIALLVTVISMLVSYGGTGAEALDHLRNAFKKLGDFVSKVFAGDFKGALDDLKEAGRDFGNFFISVADGIVKAFVKMANLVIDAVNGMLPSQFPDWVPIVGGKSFPKIPSLTFDWNPQRLANGGITTGSTLANIGEAGREAVLPLENNTGWMDDLASKIASRMPEYSANGSAVLEIDGKTAGRIFYPLIQNEASRIGTSMAVN